MSDLVIERAESSIRAYEVTHNEDSQACRLLRYLADNLRALAQENERLQAELAEHKMDCDGCLDERICLRARIRELEAEVRRLQNNEVNDCDLLGMHERRIAELEALAKCDGCGKSFNENGGICEPCHSAAISGHIKPLGQRIAELEAERDGWKDRCERAISDRDRARITHDIIANERDAIRAKTFEECAKWAYESGHVWLANDIRALAQTDESKTESGE